MSLNVTLCCDQMRTLVGPKHKPLYFKVARDSPLGHVQDPSDPFFSDEDNIQALADVSDHGQPVSNTKLTEVVDRPLEDWVNSKIAWTVTQDIKLENGIPVVLWLERKHVYDEQGKKFTCIPKKRATEPVADATTAIEIVDDDDDGDRDWGNGEPSAGEEDDGEEVSWHVVHIQVVVVVVVVVVGFVRLISRMMYVMQENNSTALGSMDDEYDSAPLSSADDSDDDYEYNEHAEAGGKKRKRSGYTIPYHTVLYCAITKHAITYHTIGPPRRSRRVTPSQSQSQSRRRPRP